MIFQPMHPDPREEKLPKWARGDLTALRQRVMEAEARADEARLATNPDESDALIDAYDSIPIGLGKGTRVRFIIHGAPIGTLHSYVDVHVNRDGELELHGGEPLAIVPQVSNAVRVKLGKLA